MLFRTRSANLFNGDHIGWRQNDHVSAARWSDGEPLMAEFFAHEFAIVPEKHAGRMAARQRSLIRISDDCQAVRNETMAQGVPLLDHGGLLCSRLDGFVHEGQAVRPNFA